MDILFSLAEFDWLSVLYVVIIILTLLIGFWKGGMKTLFTLLSFAVAIGACFLLANPVGQAIEKSALGEKIYSSLNENIGGLINALPSFAVNNEEALGEILSDLHIPEFVHGPLIEAIQPALEENGLASAGETIATSLTSIFCSGIAYIIVFLVAFIVVRLVIWVICLIVKKGKTKPNLFSRLLGLLLGAAKAFAICWVISLVVTLLISSGSEFGNYLSDIIGLNDDKFSIAKWFIETDLGYSSVIGFFTK